MKDFTFQDIDMEMIQNVDDHSPSFIGALREENDNWGGMAFRGPTLTEQGVSV